MNEMGKAIVEFEGRFDANGNLRVYDLPVEDGGGSYEIAGINDKYHPATARKLKGLIESDRHDEALEMAANHIQTYTNAVLKFFPGGSGDVCRPAEFVLRDCCFNRGPKGAATILQLALGMNDVDGVAGRQTQAELGKQLFEIGCAEVTRNITAARETYERSSFEWKRGRRDESSMFWKGLSNRWAKAHKTAMERFA